MSIAIRVLGTIDVVKNGAPCSAGGMIAKGILAVLVARRGLTVSADRLVDDVWRDRAKSSTKHTLQAHVSNLRKLLGRDTIVGEGGGYRIDLGAVNLDASEFERHSRHGSDRLRLGDLEGAESGLSNALELWRGPAYADVGDMDAIQDEIDRLDELYLHTSESRARARAGIDPVATLPELTTLFEQHPDRESLAGLLMRTLYRAGRQTDALDTYQRLRDRLLETRGIDPSPALQELELAILNQDPALESLPTAARTNLDRSPVDIVGRDELVATTLDHLRASRNVTLIGPGGIGKSTIARAAATALINEFPGGVWWVDLESVTDPNLAKETIAMAIGTEGDGDVEAVLEQRLAGGSLLVVDGAAPPYNLNESVMEWLWTRNTTLLATAREALPVPACTHLAVPALAVPTPDADIGELAEMSATRLFVDRAAGAMPGVDLYADPKLLATIVASTNGVPLEIELTAARLRTTSLESLRGVSVRDLEELVEGPGLEETDRTALVLLSGIAGAFGVGVAHALIDDEGPDVLTRLEDAAALHLIHRVAGPKQYRLVDSVRIAASRGLDADPLRTAFASRIIDWATSVPIVDAKVVLAESAAFRTALGQALELRRVSDAYRILARIGPAWITQAGGLGESLVWLRRVTDLAAEAAADVAAVWLLRARAEMRSGAYATAIESATQAIELAAACGDTRLRARGLVERGHASQFTDADLTADMERGRALAVDIGDEELTALAGLFIVQSQLLRGLPTPTGHEDLASAAATFERLERWSLAAHANAMRAAMAQLAGNIDTALALAEEAMDLAEFGDDRSIEILCLYRLSSIQSAAGRTTRSGRTATRGVRAALEVGHRPFIAALLLVLATTEAAQGHVEQARVIFAGHAHIVRSLDLAENALDQAFHVDQLHRAVGDVTELSVDGLALARELAG